MARYEEKVKGGCEEHKQTTTNDQISEGSTSHSSKAFRIPASQDSGALGLRQRSRMRVFRPVRAFPRINTVYICLTLAHGLAWSARPGSDTFRHKDDRVRGQEQSTSALIRHSCDDEGSHWYSDAEWGVNKQYKSNHEIKSSFVRAIIHDANLRQSNRRALIISSILGRAAASLDQQR